MVESGNVITFDYIWNCWKKNSYPDNFDDLLEKYLQTKTKLFSQIKVKKPTAWLSKILIAIEIGILRDKERFKPFKIYWKNILKKDWLVSIEDRWIFWKD